MSVYGHVDMFNGTLHPNLGIGQDKWAAHGEEEEKSWKLHPRELLEVKIILHKNVTCCISDDKLFLVYFTECLFLSSFILLPNHSFGFSGKPLCRSLNLTLPNTPSPALTHFFAQETANIINNAIKQSGSSVQKKSAQQSGKMKTKHQFEVVCVSQARAQTHKHASHVLLFVMLLSCWSIWQRRRLWLTRQLMKDLQNNWTWSWLRLWVPAGKRHDYAIDWEY